MCDVRTVFGQDEGTLHSTSHYVCLTSVRFLACTRCDGVVYTALFYVQQCLVSSALSFVFDIQVRWRVLSKYESRRLYEVKKVLCGRERRPTSKPGKWKLPSGSLVGGESAPMDW